jgi:hypothetical protein
MLPGNATSVERLIFRQNIERKCWNLVTVSIVTHDGWRVRVDAIEGAARQGGIRVVRSGRLKSSSFWFYLLGLFSLEVAPVRHYCAKPRMYARLTLTPFLACTPPSGWILNQWPSGVAPEYFESFRECIVSLLHYFSHFSVPVNSLTT